MEPPAMEETMPEREKEPDALEVLEKRVEAAPPLWAVQVGWLLVLVYAALFWGLYFY